MINQREIKKKDPEFYRKLLALLIPMVVQNLMNALVSASDALMVGTLDQNSLSAVSLATQISFVLNLFYAAITIGTTVMAAQYWGKKDKVSVEKIMALAFRLALLISAIFFLACFFAPQFLMRIFTGEEELVRLGSRYLKNCRLVLFIFRSFPGVSVHHEKHGKNSEKYCLWYECNRAESDPECRFYLWPVWRSKDGSCRSGSGNSACTYRGVCSLHSGKLENRCGENPPGFSDQQQ